MYSIELHILEMSLKNATTCIAFVTKLRGKNTPHKRFAFAKERDNTPIRKMHSPKHVRIDIHSAYALSLQTWSIIKVKK